MSFVLFNHTLTRKEDLSFYDVERFRVADACFESILWVDGRTPLLEGHQKRLDKACARFGFESHTISIDSLNKLAELNQIASGYARVRVSVIRKSGKNYAPTGRASNILIEIEVLKDIFNHVQQLGLYKTWKKSITPFSDFKHSNALLYVMAKQFAQANDMDEVLLYNDKEQLIEASSSNFFFVSDQQIYCPKRENGGVNGVSQGYIINFFNVKEVYVSESMLETADEIFLSNAVQLIQPVEKYVNRSLSTTFTKGLIKQIKLNLQV